MDLEKLFNSNEYIDIESLAIYLEKNKEKLSIMKKAYIHNLKLTKEEAELNKKLIDLNNQEIVVSKNNTARLVKVNKVKNVLPIQIDITDIYNKVINVNSIEELRKILEDIDDRFDVINLILLKYYKELKIIEKFSLTDNDELFKDEYNTILDKINILTKFRDEKLKDMNHLIYLKNNSGNPSIYKSIENNITLENYESLDGLFLSIEDGTLKNNKMINKGNSSYTHTFCEVRDDQLRITYIKLKSNIYLVLDCFTKKYWTNSIYKSNIESSLKSYQRQIDEINNSLKNEDYLIENDQITSNIHELLKQKKKVKNGTIY